jgi:hypothetical protein
MLLEICSAAAFAPPPPTALYEPADMRGTGFAPARARTSPALANVTTATTVIEEPSSQAAPKRSHFARMALDLAKRVQSLKIEAELDGVPFSLASYADFLSFLTETQPRSRPSLFLNDNGNLRVLWRNDAREQIGLQFLGGGNIQFVIFKHRPGADAMTRVAGMDTKANILGYIKASGALGLLAG